MKILIFVLTWAAFVSSNPSPKRCWPVYNDDRTSAPPSTTLKSDSTSIETSTVTSTYETTSFDLSEVIRQAEAQISALTTKLNQITSLLGELSNPPDCLTILQHVTADGIGYFREQLAAIESGALRYEDSVFFNLATAGTTVGYSSDVLECLASQTTEGSTPQETTDASTVEFADSTTEALATETTVDSTTEASTTTAFDVGPLVVQLVSDKAAATNLLNDLDSQLEDPNALACLKDIRNQVSDIIGLIYYRFKIIANHPEASQNIESSESEINDIIANQLPTCLGSTTIESTTESATESTTDSTTEASTTTTFDVGPLTAQLESEKAVLTNLLNDLDSQLEDPSAPTCLTDLRNQVSDIISLIYYRFKTIANHPEASINVGSFDAEINDIIANQLPTCLESITTESTTEASTVTTEELTTTTTFDVGPLTAQLESEKSVLTNLLNDLDSKLTDPNPPICLTDLRNQVSDIISLIYYRFKIIANYPEASVNVGSFDAEINDIIANQLPVCLASVATTESTTEASTTTTYDVGPLTAQLESEKSVLTNLLNDLDSQLEDPNAPACVTDLRNQVSDIISLIYYRFKIIANYPEASVNVGSFDSEISDIIANQLPSCLSSITTTEASTTTTFDVGPLTDQLNLEKSNLTSLLVDLDLRLEDPNAPGCLADLRSQVSDFIGLIYYRFKIIANYPEASVNIEPIGSQISDIYVNQLPACVA